MNKSPAYPVLLLTSCSAPDILRLPIDPTTATTFGERVKQRFMNYAASSGYQSPEPRDPNLRDGEREPVIIIHAKGVREQLVIYTFDGSDSCIIYSGPLKAEMDEIRIKLIPIPAGRYWLRFHDSIDSFDRP